ncbi:hypothetical protein IAT40_006787 [Kwoniella sp. CBS 6097]
MTYSYLLLAALVAQSAVAQQYGSAFLSCIASANKPSGAIAGSDFINTPQDCVDNCGGSTYAYFTEYFPLFQSAGCLCSNTPPSNSWVTSTVSAAQDETCATNTDFAAYKVRTTEQFQGCASASSYQSTGGYNSIEACLSACAYSPYTFARPVDSNWQCACGSSLGSPTYTACGSNSYLAYYHDAIAQASQLTRRKLRERLSDISRQSADCPAGLTACIVAGYSDSFECIDTSAEIESCGGCINGVFGQTNATSGSDCTALTGVALGAVTCSAGRCESFACQDGFSLVSGECIAA